MATAMSGKSTRALRSSAEVQIDQYLVQPFVDQILEYATLNGDYLARDGVYKVFRSIDFSPIGLTEGHWSTRRDGIVADALMQMYEDLPQEIWWMLDAMLCGCWRMANNMTIHQWRKQFVGDQISVSMDGLFKWWKRERRKAS